MNIWVYSDESGVFDKKHEQFFVFGGLILLSDDDRQTLIRKYSKAEGVIKDRYRGSQNKEIKASSISNEEKGKLFRSLNSAIKFGTIIKIDKVNKEIFWNKKHKQRYLDYAYKIALKEALKRLISSGRIKPGEVENIYVFQDEHTTATSGRYELHESLEREFKIGTFNQNYSVYFRPLFTNLQSLHVQYCNSKKKTLIRAADIIANRLYHAAKSGEIGLLNSIKNLYYIIQPD